MLAEAALPPPSVYEPQAPDALPPAWAPLPKQQEFLSAPDDIVLYGGAAGGGKSDSLLVDALGLWQRGIDHPSYHALLLRRSFPELRDLIDRSQEIYPVVAPGAKYNAQEKTWTFPGGGKVEFGYLMREQDRFQYQGRAFTYIGFDELTLYASPVAFWWMFTRLRNAHGLRCLLRATCNPGGVGHTWVQKTWRISDDGGATRFACRIGPKLVWMRFIPARLSDNHYLDGPDGTYRTNLLLQSEMDRRALLDGRWDVIDIPGSIYGDQISDAMVGGRLRDIPIIPGVPVHTFWDLGRRDTTVIWFMQQIGREFRFVDYYEANGEWLQHYAEVVHAKGYTYGRHYLPHDVEVTELSSNESRRELLERLRVKPIETVPRIDNIAEGIELVRRVLPLCWFDKTRCERGLNALKSYRRKWNEQLSVFSHEPLHDWASNGADAFRQFAQGYPIAANTPPTSGKRRSQPAASGNWKAA
jgi:hypothetical protein